MRRVPEEAVFGTEYLFRTVEACFLHRMPLKMRRVPQEAFLSTARIFRTIGGPLRYRMPTQRQVAAAAEPGVHFSRPLAGSWLRGYQSCKLPPEIVAYKISLSELYQA